MKDKPCILVVDDDPNISRLEQLYLEKENYEVKVAADGNEAIDSFRKMPPDLVLLDVMLPSRRMFASTSPVGIPDAAALIAVSTSGRCVSLKYVLNSVPNWSNVPFSSAEDKPSLSFGWSLSGDT